MNGTALNPDEVFIVPAGLDPEVIAEYGRQMKVSAQEASDALEKLGRALLEAESGQTKPGEFYQNRAARRARERAERKRARG